MSQTSWKDRTMATSPMGLFAKGDILHTLIRDLIRDLAMASVERIASEDDIQRILSDPLFSRGFDEFFSHQLLEDMEQDLTAVLAGEAASEDDIQRILSDPLFSKGLDESFLHQSFDLSSSYKAIRRQILCRAQFGFRLAQEHISPLVRDIPLHLMKIALALGENQLAEDYARVGIEDLGKDAPPSYLADCHDVMGRSLYNQGNFQKAIPVFEVGASHASAAGDLHQEWDLLTSVVACYYLMGDHLAAIRAANRALEVARKTGDPSALSKSLGDLGNAELSLGRLDRAEEVFYQALRAAEEAKDEQRQSDWLGNLGNILFKQGSLQEAAAYHTRALEISRRIGNDQSEEMDLANLGRTRWAQEKWNEALRCLAEAITIAERRDDMETAKRYREELRNMHLSLGHYHQAYALDRLTDSDNESLPVVEITETPAKAQPEMSSSEHELERSFMAKMKDRDLKGTHRLVEDFIVHQPGSWAGYFFRGFFLNETGKFQESIEAYEHALDLNPGGAHIHHNLINSWRGLGDLRTPRKKYEQLVAEAPYDPVLRVALGRIYRMLERHDEAIRELREAMRLDPHNYMGLLNLCEELCAKGISILETNWNAGWAYFEDSMICFSDLIELDEERRVNSLVTAGEHLVQMALESCFANPPLMEPIGEREMHFLAWAVAFFSRAIEERHDLNRPRDGYQRVMSFLDALANASVFQQMGRLLREIGEDGLAIYFLERSIQTRPDFAEPYYQLGLALSETAMDNQTVLAQAETMLESAVRLAPENVSYLGALRRLRRMHSRSSRDSKEADNEHK